ncbi:MAG: hypothetical protein JWR08_1221 [Enterovirga sp.]|nr:hypothetical protein [Enterovirga sp.]
MLIRLGAARPVEVGDPGRGKLRDQCHGALRAGSDPAALALGGLGMLRASWREPVCARLNADPSPSRIQPSLRSGPADGRMAA